MVTQLFLVQSFKVRVLVDQQKIPIVRLGFFDSNILKNYILKVTTGLTAWFTKSSLILPLKKWAKPFLPCVLIPIKSASMWLAKFKIPFSTLVSLYICVENLFITNFETKLSIISCATCVGLKLLGVFIITKCNSEPNLLAKSTTFSNGFLISFLESDHYPEYRYT